MKKEMGKVVLLVDDNDDQRKFLAAMLITNGLLPVSASSGQQALDIFKQHRAVIDAVVLDVRLKGETGFDVYKLLYQIDKNVNVVFMSADAVETPDGKPILQKPFSPGQLSDALIRAKYFDETG